MCLFAEKGFCFSSPIPRISLSISMVGGISETQISRLGIVSHMCSISFQFLNILNVQWSKIILLNNQLIMKNLIM